MGFCRANGVEVCEAGALKQICVPGDPIDEVCDGLDNDCDGTADEDLTDEPTVCGVGQCRRDGTWSCMAGVFMNTCEPGEPTIETCDGIDEDCDGVADEDLDCTPTSTTSEDGDGSGGESASATDTDDAGGTPNQQKDTEDMMASSDSGGCSIQSNRTSTSVWFIWGLLLLGRRRQKRGLN